MARLSAVLFGNRSQELHKREEGYFILEFREESTPHPLTSGQSTEWDCISEDKIPSGLHFEAIDAHAKGEFFELRLHERATEKATELNKNRPRGGRPWTYLGDVWDCGEGDTYTDEEMLSEDSTRTFG